MRRPVRARTCVCCETVPQEQLGDPTRFLNGREVMEEVRRWRSAHPRAPLASAMCFAAGPHMAHPPGGRVGEPRQLPGVQGLREGEERGERPGRASPRPHQAHREELQAGGEPAGGHAGHQEGPPAPSGAARGRISTRRSSARSSPASS